MLPPPSTSSRAISPCTFLQPREMENAERGWRGYHLSGKMEDTKATAAASVEDEKMGTRTAAFVMSMLT